MKIDTIPILLPAMPPPKGERHLVAGNSANQDALPGPLKDTWEVLVASGNKAEELPETLLDLFEERAAIMQFDGGLSRAEAERMAWADVMVRE